MNNSIREAPRGVGTRPFRVGIGTAIAAWAWIAALGAVLLIARPSVSIAGGEGAKQVLVLHSHHRCAARDDKMDEGIDSILGKAEPLVNIQFEYMDSNRIDDPEHLEKVFDLQVYKFRERTFDVIIGLGDNALAFLLRRGDAIFPKTPVVFGGVNHVDDSILKRRRLFTGVVETADFRETIDLALKLHPRTRRIVVFGDDTPTWRANKERVETMARSYKEIVDFHIMENLHISEIFDRVRNLPDDSLLFPLSSMRDERGERMPAREFTELMSAARTIPMYSCREHLLGGGVVGGKVISGFIQGETAARIALRILKGERVETIRVVGKSPNRWMFDYNQLVRFGVGLTDLPEGSLVVNRPRSFYATHKTLVRTGGAGLAFVSVIMMALINGIFKRKRAEHALRENRERLEELVKERTRALGKSEKLLRTVIKVTRDAMISIDREGRVILFNPAAEKMFGRAKEEMMGRPLDHLIPETHREAHRKNIEAYFKTGLPNGAVGRIVELPGMRSNGDIFPMNVSLSEGAYDQERFVIAVARDITARKKVEESLRLEMIQREQAEEQLKVLVEDLERANKELQDFAQIVSHDLKAPLRGVISLANWLREDYAETLEESGREYIHKLISRTRRMHGLIDGILQYSRAGRASVKAEPVSTRAIVTEIIDSIDPPETIPVVIQDPMPTIVYDKMQLKQLFQNLIGNAIEHLGKPRGRVAVSCADQGDAWEFCVRDNGVGIEKKNFEIIFKIFQSLTPRSESTGVGLSLIRKIVERNGGLVRVESTVGAGSAFYFTAPKRAAPERRRRRRGAVLIIDDSQGFSDVAATMVKREGREALCAIDGNEARRILETHERAIDLALMDIYIPNENPIERYDMLKALRPRMKIIVCTGGGLTETVERLKKRGADGVLMKPFKGEELKGVLE